MNQNTVHVYFLSRSANQVRGYAPYLANVKYLRRIYKEGRNMKVRLRGLKVPLLIPGTPEAIPIKSEQDIYINPKVSKQIKVL